MGELVPAWPFTEELRETRPWGLAPELLAFKKRFTDPVHGDVELTALEVMLLDSAPMQHLRRVRQLGATPLVYYGATHTRFAHAVGTLASAQRILDSVLDHRRKSPRQSGDLLSEWEADGPELYRKRLSEATVLARLGGLLHDLCHVPYGHTIEDDLDVLVSHDANRLRFEELWAQLPSRLHDLVNRELFEALVPLIVSKQFADNGSLVAIPLDDHPYPFVLDVVGNTICADLLDYVHRDHAFLGLPYAAGTRFMEGFYITSSDDLYPARLVIDISRNGVVRRDAVTELFKLLRYRYELTERALYHHAKLSADAMMGKLLEMWRDAIWVDQATERGVQLGSSDAADIDAARRVAAREGLDCSEIDDEVQAYLEREFTRRSDDGLLEFLLFDWSPSLSGTRRERAIRDLAGRILNRDLFKRIGVSHSSKPNAATLRSQFGDAGTRRRLEREAAIFIGARHRWHIVLWIPSPSMRLKAADVLVYDGKRVAPLKNLGNGSSVGAQLNQAHEALWGISVFVDASLADNEMHCRALLSYLSGRLKGVSWDNLPTQPPTPPELAVESVRERRSLTVQEGDGLVAELRQAVAYGGNETWSELVSQATQLAEKSGPEAPESEGRAFGDADRADSHGQLFPPSDEQ